MPLYEIIVFFSRNDNIDFIYLKLYCIMWKKIDGHSSNQAMISFIVVARVRATCNQIVKKKKKILTNDKSTKISQISLMFSDSKQPLKGKFYLSLRNQQKSTSSEKLDSR